MNDKRKTVSKKAGIRIGLVVALVMGMSFAYIALPMPKLIQDEYTESWHIVWEGPLTALAEANPGEGVGGILEVFITNHSATPDTTYLQNTSATIEGWCTAAGFGYATADATNIDTAHSTAFDVVVRVRGNETMCDRDGDWFDADLKVEWTCADLSVGADTAMTGVVTLNNTGLNYLYMNFYDDNSGSGYTIGKGDTVEITSIKFSAYY